MGTGEWVGRGGRRKGGRDGGEGVGEWMGMEGREMGEWGGDGEKTARWGDRKREGWGDGGRDEWGEGGVGEGTQ